MNFCRQRTTACAIPQTACSCLCLHRAACFCDTPFATRRLMPGCARFLAHPTSVPSTSPPSSCRAVCLIAPCFCTHLALPQDLYLCTKTDRPSRLSGLLPRHPLLLLSGCYTVNLSLLQFVAVWQRHGMENTLPPCTQTSLTWDVVLSLLKQDNCVPLLFVPHLAWT